MGPPGLVLHGGMDGSMTEQGQDVAADLRRLIAEGCISEGALQAVTRITQEMIAAFLADDSAGAERPVAEEPTLSPQEMTRVSILGAQLAYGFEIDDDERLRAILETLTVECGFTLPHISRLTRVALDDLTTALDDPGALESEGRYRIALRASYLINAVNQARPVGA